MEWHCTNFLSPYTIFFIHKQQMRQNSTCTIVKCFEVLIWVLPNLIWFINLFS